jgi:hypothetical protein
VGTTFRSWCPRTRTPALSSSRRARTAPGKAGARPRHPAGHERRRIRIRSIPGRTSLAFTLNEAADHGGGLRRGRIRPWASCSGEGAGDEPGAGRPGRGRAAARQRRVPGVEVSGTRSRWCCGWRCGTNDGAGRGARRRAVYRGRPAYRSGLSLAARRARNPSATAITARVSRAGVHARYFGMGGTAPPPPTTWGALPEPRGSRRPAALRFTGMISADLDRASP